MKEIKNGGYQTWRRQTVSIEAVNVAHFKMYNEDINIFL